MKYFENSLFYRITAGSWLFGWIVATPEDRSCWYTGSILYRIITRVIDGIVALLSRVGRWGQKYEKSSVFIGNPLGFIGILVFFYFAFDLLLHDYSFTRTALEAGLAAFGFIIMFNRAIPGIWQGSIIYRILHWWQTRD